MSSEFTIVIAFGTAFTDIVFPSSPVKFTTSVEPDGLYTAYVYTSFFLNTVPIALLLVKLKSGTP